MADRIGEWRPQVSRKETVREFGYATLRLGPDGDPAYTLSYMDRTRIRYCCLGTGAELSQARPAWNLTAEGAHAFLAGTIRALVRNVSEVGGGAALGSLAEGPITRMQNAADRPIVPGKESRSSAAELPEQRARGRAGRGGNALGRPTGIDVFRDYNPGALNYTTLGQSRPHSIFDPD